MSQKKTPKVSICIITYDHEKYIVQCLDSLLNQKKSNLYEIIIGDDCSTDSTRKLLKEYADKNPNLIKLILHERRQGMAKNYISVHQAAQGDYICHCDGDDFWEPEKIKKQVDFLEQERNCCAVFTNSFITNESGSRVGFFSKNVKRIFDLDYLIRDGNFLHHSSIMYRSNMRTHMFPNSLEFIDFHIYVLLIRGRQFGYIDEFLTSYRTQSISSVIRSNAEHIRNLEWQALLEAKYAFIDQASIRGAVSNFLANIAHSAFLMHDWSYYKHWSSKAHEQFRGVAPLSLHLYVIVSYISLIKKKIGFKLLGIINPERISERVFYPKK